MKRFWQWMKKNEYSGYSNMLNSYKSAGHITPTHQMLIGYMIEYLSEKGIFIA